MDYKNDLNSDDDFDCSNGYSDSYGSNGRMSNPNGMSKAELRKVSWESMDRNYNLKFILKFKKEFLRRNIRS